MKTIIAEKPSVAREIARIVGATKREEGYFEGGGYAVTWAFGHLVQLAMPDGYGVRGFVRDNLPIIPDTFTLVPRQVRTEKGYKPDSGVVSQIKTIKRLFGTSDQIIVATDAGREGELIFRYLYHYTGSTTPFVRLWISSLTDKAIREGLRNLEDGGKYDNLYLAAKARSESDWLVGINGTQALSIAAGHGTYSVGRVQTPTLAMVCERYWENRRFTPEAFWQLHIATDGCDGKVVKFSSSEKWKSKEPATELYNKIEAYTREITSELLSCDKLFGSRDSGCACPKCGTGRMRFYGKVVRCDNTECGLPVFRLKAGRTLSDDEIKDLLTEGHTQLLKGFKSKQGKSFDAVVAFDGEYNTTFVFPEAKKGKKFSGRKK